MKRQDGTVDDRAILGFFGQYRAGTGQQAEKQAAELE